MSINGSTNFNETKEDTSPYNSQVSDEMRDEDIEIDSKCHLSLILLAILDFHWSLGGTWVVLEGTFGEKQQIQQLVLQRSNDGSFWISLVSVS